MSLDELLTSAREHRSEPERSRFRVSGLIKIAIPAVALGFVAYHLLLASGWRAPYLLVTGVLLALGVTARIVFAAYAPREAVPDADEAEPAEWGYQSSHDRPYDGIRRWISRLSHVDIDRTSFPRVAQPAIVALIDERLRLRHGVDRQRDPRRARQLLGEPLWTFVTQPMTKSPKPAAMAALAEQIEKL